jgi:hypothetical protein
VQVGSVESRVGEEVGWVVGCLPALRSVSVSVIMRKGDYLHEFSIFRIDDVFTAKQDTDAFAGRFDVRLRERRRHFEAIS